MFPLKRFLSIKLTQSEVVAVHRNMSTSNKPKLVTRNNFISNRSKADSKNFSDNLKEKTTPNNRANFLNKHRMKQAWETIVT